MRSSSLGWHNSMQSAGLHAHLPVVQACQLLKQHLVTDAKHSNSSNVVCCFAPLQPFAWKFLLMADCSVASTLNIGERTVLNVMQMSWFAQLLCRTYQQLREYGLPLHTPHPKRLFPKLSND